MIAVSQLARREARDRRWLDEICQQMKDGRPVTDSDRVLAFRRFAESGCLPTLEPILPLILNLKGKAYRLTDHFPFSPCFRVRMPRDLVLKTGRQVSKSTSLAASGVVIANAIPHFTTLYVTPLFEQIRRFSTNYVRPFIDQSPVKALWSDTTTENSVLQRSFRNQSKMIFSFAFLDADRIRGITSDRVCYDECQDLNRDFIPIITETMSHSDYGMSMFTGTPKTLDGTLEGLYQRSSMAEWFVPCFACGEWNIPSVDHHLFAMIGPYRDDISADKPAVICHKCRRPIFPRLGRWVHRHPDRRWDMAGYHVPQVIMPIHYERPGKWSILLSKQAHTAPHNFHNEVLGESYDTGSKLVTLTEIKAAACLDWTNNQHEPDPAIFERLGRYPMRVLGIDWGGGGKEGVSFTTLALLGWRTDGKIDVLWGKRLWTPHDHLREAFEIRNWVQKLRPHLLAHDYTGAGSLRETVLVQAGVPLERIMACAYVRSASHGIVTHRPATPDHPRDHYMVDKTRSLLYTTNAIKLGVVRTFKYDYVNDDQPGLLHDFLALIDEKVETPTTAGIYVIKRQEGFSDDFAHAVNLGCTALWHANESWPDYAATFGFAKLTPDQLAAAVGPAEGGDELMQGYFSGP